MLTSNISLILPLVDAQRNRKTGSKATNLSKLIAAHFNVPRGFVISADAYRSHLWSSGMRETASAAIEAGEREAVRSAILSNEIPADILDAITQAYERLSWQTGDAEPRVVVRPSAIGEDFPGAFESFLNVSGLPALTEAVKQVWASLWDGRAVACRANASITSEPAMAIIVQQMLDYEYAGTISTANPVTGDPMKMLVNIDGYELNQYAVDLRDFAITRQSEAGNPIDEDIIKLAVEQAVLIEDVIESRLEIEWAYDGEKLWILQIRPIADLPEYFPAAWPNEADGKVLWKLQTPQPVSFFARSLLWQNSRRGSDVFPGVKDISRSCMLNGRIYTHREDTLKDRCGTKPKQGIDIQIASRLLREWLKEIRRDICSRSMRIINSDLSEMNHDALSKTLTDAADAVRTTADWMDKADYPSRRLPEALHELLSDKLDGHILYLRLLSCISDSTLLRDAKLQELGERFAIAEDTGKLGEEKWWRGYKHDVESFSREYGYAFKDAGELHDIASWRSWVEDTDAVFRMIGAIADQDNRLTLVTQHCAAEIDAAEAEAQCIKEFQGKTHNRFNELLRLSRAWLTTRNDTEASYALACTALRLIIIELAARLQNAGLISEKEDIFFLSLDELLSVPANSSEEDRIKITAIIADRKHELWLEKRLYAPERLPISDVSTFDKPTDQQFDGVIKGVFGSPGRVSGRARIVSRIEDAGEIKNGDILIVKTSGLAWTPFFAVAGGLVSEQGHELSQEAIVARKCGIPAVMDCHNTTSIVKDGQMIYIDGSEGLVRLRLT